jgi:ABC-2 type transport system permease protein
MSLLTKAAAQAFNGSAASVHVLKRLTQATNVGATSYLGIVFFMVMILVMCYAASAVGRMRQDEAEGYLDNMLVRSTSRMRWLWGRITLAAIVILACGLLSSSVVRFGIIGQDTGVSFHTLVYAGLNSVIPAFLVLGFGVLSFGAIPRLTSVVAYSVVGWSFLLDMVSSGLNLNHWILDTSVFHHVAFAPATDPVWRTNWILVSIALALCCLGAVRFNSRDLAGD